MISSELCKECFYPATRTLGTIPYCDQCAHNKLAPLVRKYGSVKVQPHEGKWLMHCANCSAEWITDDRLERCDWCHERWIKQELARKRDILEPPWLLYPSERFDQLTPEDQEIWTATRGQRVSEQEQEQWSRDLIQAHQTGLIADHELTRTLTLLKRCFMKSR